MAEDVHVTGPGPAQLKALAVKLRDADPLLRRELRRGLRDAARPAADAARASILAMPSRHGGTLRSEVAATITTHVSTAATIKAEVTAEPRKMPAGKQSLPGHLDSPKGWKHPVYGHRDRWVRQYGKPRWFEGAVARAAPDARAAAEDAIDATAQHLAGL